jgi:hypothetical protein
MEQNTTETEPIWKKSWKAEEHPKIEEFFLCLKDQDTEWGKRKALLVELAEFFASNKSSKEALDELFQELLPCTKSQVRIS